MFSMVLSAAYPSPDVASFGPWSPFARAMEISRSDSGVNVTAFKALQLSAVYSCVKIISWSLGSLHCYPYRATDKTKKLDSANPIYPLLQRGPTPYMSFMTWVVTMVQHLLLSAGNSYNYIERSGDGTLMGLWLLRPDRVTPRAQGDDIVYDVQEANGVLKTYAYDEILHIPGWGYDGYIGYTPISVHRELFGSALGQQGFGSALYRNGVRPAGVFTHPQKMKPEPFGRLKEQLQQYAGTANAGKALILEEGMSWAQLGMNMHDAQFIQQQNFTDRQIAAIFGVPAKMIGDTEAESYGSAEADMRWFVDQTLRPWAELIEQEMERKLFPDEPDVCIRFDFAGLLRGDATSRATANQILRRNGVINANQWLESEDMNPIPGEIGEKYLVESNMTTMEMVGQPPIAPSLPPSGAGPPNEDGDDEGDERPTDESAGIARESVTAGHRRAFVEILDRMAKIEATSRQRAEKAGGGACAKATDDHFKLLVSAIGPAADAYAVSLAAVLRCPNESERVHIATKAAAFVAMNNHPTAEACVDAVMRTIAEAVA